MKRKTTILWITLVSLIFLLFQGKAIYAASASVAFSTTRSDFVVEDEFIVTLTAESSAGISGFQTYVAYDTTMLELTDTGRHVSGGDGLIFISDLDGDEQIRDYHMKFRALSPGETEVYISDTIYMYSGTDSQQMSVSKNTLKLKIGQQQTVENDNSKNLASLDVSVGELMPAFEPKISEYQVTVPSDVDMLYIDAKARLKACTVKISGNDKLQEGDNLATVVVTGKDGAQKIYNIHIKKMTKEEEKLQQEEEAVLAEEEEEVVVENAVSIKDKDGIWYLNSNVSLEVVPVPDFSLIPSGYVESVLSVDGKNFAVYAPEEDSSSEFVLIYGRMGNREAMFYRYDRIEQTIQRYESDSFSTVSTTESRGEEKENQPVWMNIFLGVLALVGLVLLIEKTARNIRVTKSIERSLDEEEYEEEDEFDE